MGFLGEIERRKQQQIQQELNRKAELERQQQIAAQKAVQEIAQKAAKENEIFERNSKGFIKDSSIIASLLNQLHECGYKGYFENVSEISGFELDKRFYTEYPQQEIHSPKNSEKSPELIGQQKNIQEELEHTVSQLGWSKLTWALGIEKEIAKPPNVMFFGDDIAGARETKEVGIGIRFLRHVGTKEKRIPMKSFFRKEYKYPIEKQYQAVYIRLDAHSKATITGSNQRQVDLKDLRLLDEVLEQAIDNPAIFHTKHTRTWYPPYKNKFGDGGSFEDRSGYGEGPCLPGDSFISVPSGFVPIKSLKSGDLVWTVDGFGHKVQAVIIQKTKRIVSKYHKMAHIVLKDGRELTVSPGHPTTDNKEIGNLVKGQVLDKSQIVSIQIMSYKEKYTYDILPSGDTGGYWANNILIGSILSNQFKQIQWYRQLFV